MPRKQLLLLFSFSAICLMNPVENFAQKTIIDSSLKGMTWRNIGPNRGGRSLGIAGSAKNKMEYYFGAVGGGLWKTIDGGLTWKPVTDSQMTSSSVGAVAVSPSTPNIVYI